MKMMTFAKRCAKEILRDPLTLCFGLGFPLMILLLLHTIQSNIPAALFTLDSLAPGVAVFGLSFMTLFSATLISKDRESAFLQRLYTTPLTGMDFILGYMLPMLPLAFLQGVCSFLVGALLGLRLTVNILLAALFVLLAISGWFDILALVLPLTFVRPAITVAEFFRKKG